MYFVELLLLAKSLDSLTVKSTLNKAKYVNDYRKLKELLCVCVCVCDAKYTLKKINFWCLCRCTICSVCSIYDFFIMPKTFFCSVEVKTNHDKTFNHWFSFYPFELLNERKTIFSFGWVVVVGSWNTQWEIVDHKNYQNTCTKSKFRHFQCHFSIILNLWMD